MEADINYKFQEVVDTGTQVYDFGKVNKTCPDLITIGGQKQNRSEYLRLAIYTILQCATGDRSDIGINRMSVVNPEAAMNIKRGNLSKTEYISHIRPPLVGYMDANRKNPELDTISLGSMNLNKAVIVYSYILSLFNLNKTLPAEVDVTTQLYPTDKGSVSSTIPDNLKQYLVTTNNCQVNDSTIQSLAASLKGSTPLQTAKNIFYYVRDKIEYDFYKNTLRGAIKTYKEKIANCCDLSHLEIALLRANGIPARYIHVDDQFTSIRCGHVAAQPWISGTWYNMDASNNNNAWNQIGGTVKAIYGYYAELPF